MPSGSQIQPTPPHTWAQELAWPFPGHGLGLWAAAAGAPGDGWEESTRPAPSGSCLGQGLHGALRLSKKAPGQLPAPPLGTDGLASPDFSESCGHQKQSEMGTRGRQAGHLQSLSFPRRPFWAGRGGERPGCFLFSVSGAKPRKVNLSQGPTPRGKALVPRKMLPSSLRLL